MMIDVDEVLDKAFECYNLQQYEEAEYLLAQAQKILPSHGDLLYLKGLILIKKHQWIQAYDSLFLAQKLYPQQSVYKETIVEALIGMKKFKESKEILTSLPLTETIRFKLALIEKEQGNIQTSIEMFQKLVDSSLASEAYFELAFLVEDKKKLSYLQKSFEIKPNEKNATEIIKVFFAKKSKIDIEKYLKYIHNEYTLACIDVLLKKDESALNKLQKYLKKKPEDESGWLLMGQINERLKLIKQAQESYQKVLNLNNNSFEGHHLIAKLLMRQGRFSEALNHYQIICRIEPENKEILMAMALLAEHTENHSEAIGLYFRLLSLGQKNISGLIQKNIIKLSQKDLSLARDFVKGWAKSFPKSKTAQNLLKKFCLLLIILGCSLPSLAQLTQDEKQWQIVWESKMAENGDPESLFYMGQLFEKGEKMPQDFPQAIHYYEQAAAKDYLPACVRLAQIFATHPILKDEKKSNQWYTYAAEKGDIQSEFFMADYYQQRPHIDLIKAKKYLEKALKQTFPNETDFSKVSPQYANLLEKTNRKNDTLTERK